MLSVLGRYAGLGRDALSWFLGVFSSRFVIRCWVLLERLLQQEWYTRASFLSHEVAEIVRKNALLELLCV